MTFQEELGILIWRGRPSSILREINQAYVRKSVRKRALEMGYPIEEDRVLENNEIELVVCEPL